MARALSRAGVSRRARSIFEHSGGPPRAPRSRDRALATPRSRDLHLRRAPAGPARPLGHGSHRERARMGARCPRGEARPPESAPMKLRTLLDLARISNLPTV